MKTIRSKNIFLAVLYILSVTWDASLNHIGAETGKVHYSAGTSVSRFHFFFVAGGWFALNYRYARHIENRIVIPALLLFIGGHLLHTDVLQPATFTIMILWLGFPHSILSSIGQNRDFPTRFIFSLPHYCHSRSLRVVYPLLYWRLSFRFGHHHTFGPRGLAHFSKNKVVLYKRKLKIWIEKTRIIYVFSKNNKFGQKGNGC